MTLAQPFGGLLSFVGFRHKWGSDDSSLNGLKEPDPTSPRTDGTKDCRAGSCPPAGALPAGGAAKERGSFAESDCSRDFGGDEGADARAPDGGGGGSGAVAAFFAA